jgi:hypothetical protein
MKGTVRRGVASVLVALAGSLLHAGPTTAQLRPHQPIDWHMFDPGRVVSASIGVGVLHDQPASLAGTVGRLLELGNFQVAWRSGRIGLELGGTLSRHFEDRRIVRPAALGADDPGGRTRTDAGDIRASTAIRLNGIDRSSIFTFRFGTRLPTTSEEEGLDRDRTDFFALLGARVKLGALGLAGESGLAINGSRVPQHDQNDVLTYDFRADYPFGPILVSATIVGHEDMHSRVIRGNEDLSELRLELRAGDRHWIQVVGIKGLADFSPGEGLLVAVGIRR